jgi:hypothetical protein
MKRWQYILVLAVAAFVGFGTGQTIAEKEAAREKSELHDARYDLGIERTKLQILACESGVRHDGVWGDGGKSYGIAQFQHATFKWMRDQSGRPELKWMSQADQLWLLDWALRRGYGRYWTCYGKAVRSAEFGVRNKTKETEHEG